MRRERIQKKVWKQPTRPLEILPLDPRDPDIVRAKSLRASMPRRRRAS